MSLTDPDARNRRISSALRPLGWVLGILSLATAPIMIAISSAIGYPDTSRFLVDFLLYVGLTVGLGLLLYYTAAHRNGLGIAAFIIAYVGGLILLLGMVPDKNTGLPEGLVPALVIYGIAVVLLIIYIVHATAAHETLQNGVTTTATVTSAGINGMINYVQHWRLTLKFTDQDGRDRWFHIGRTGLSYAVGQEFQIRYNPRNPGRGIVVLNG